MSIAEPTLETAVEPRCHDQAGDVVIVDERRELTQEIMRQAGADPGTSGCRISTATDLNSAAADTVVFSPLRARRGRLVADADYAEAVFQGCRQANISRLVLISSAEVYGADYSNPGLISESRTGPLKRAGSIAQRWATIESLAGERLGGSDCQLLILRPCYTLSRDGRDFASRLFRGRFASRLAGYDPSIQLLGVEDLAAAIVAAIARGEPGVYNVAPDGVIPLRKALRRAGAWSIPIPYTVQRMARALLSPLRLAGPAEDLQFIRHSWTVSNRKIKDRLAFQPRQSSAEVVSSTNRKPRSASSSAPAAESPAESFDDFGMDEDYIRACGRRQMGFMEKVYWRVEADGLENLPREGGAVLAGIHRGFMPFDGVIMVQLMQKNLGRIPRFLMHPTLVKFPHLSGFLTRHGGIIACQENAEYVLERNEIVGFFPEGIRGAFKKYDRDVYRIGNLRDDYAMLAARYRVPIVPFVTVGPAEIFPILAKFDWPWWKRQTHWPCFPITPTWPVLPAPLPSKWHIRFLEPIEPAANLAPGAAGDRRAARRVSKQVRHAMQTAIDEMLIRRKSIFFGSIFDRDRPSRTAVQHNGATPHGATTPREESAPPAASAARQEKREVA